jgi:hypothetical protein
VLVGAASGGLEGAAITIGGACWHAASIRPIAVTARMGMYLKMRGFVVIGIFLWAPLAGATGEMRARFRPQLEIAGSGLIAVPTATPNEDQVIPNLHEWTTFRTVALDT